MMLLQLLQRYCDSATRRGWQIFGHPAAEFSSTLVTHWCESGPTDRDRDRATSELLPKDKDGAVFSLHLISVRATRITPRDMRHSLRYATTAARRYMSGQGSCPHQLLSTPYCKTPDTHLARTVSRRTTAPGDQENIMLCMIKGTKFLAKKKKKRVHYQI